jgi:hypothetical protein
MITYTEAYKYELDGRTIISMIMPVGIKYEIYTKLTAGAGKLITTGDGYLTHLTYTK